MPFEDQATQMMAESAKTTARKGLLLTARTIQILLKLAGISTVRALTAFAHHMDKTVHTGKMSLKRLNRITHGKLAPMDVDERVLTQLITRLKRAGINYSIAHNTDGPGCLYFPADSLPLIQHEINIIYQNTGINPQLLSDATMSDAQVSTLLSDPHVHTVAGNMKYATPQHDSITHTDTQNRDSINRSRKAQGKKISKHDLTTGITTGAKNRSIQPHTHHPVQIHKKTR